MEDAAEGQVLKLCLEGHNVIFTGQCGTGKTVLMRATSLQQPPMGRLKTDCCREGTDSSRPTERLLELYRGLDAVVCVRTMAIPYILRICITLIMCSGGISMQDQFGELVCMLDGDILTATILVFKNTSTFYDVYMTDSTQLDVYNGNAGCEMTGFESTSNAVTVRRAVDITTDQPTDGQGCGLIVSETHVLYEWRVRTQHQNEYIKYQDKIFVYQCNATSSLPVVIWHRLDFLLKPVINLSPTSETLILNVVDKNNAIITSTDIGEKIALRLKFKYDNIALDPPNLALGKSTVQSSDSASVAPAGRAVDGVTSTTLLAGSCSQTDPDDTTNTQYWQVDLGAVYDISEVRVANRADGVGDQLASIEVEVGVTTSSFKTCYKFTGPGTDASVYTFTCEEILAGRYVRIRKTVPGLLTFCEVEVYGVDLGPYGVYCKKLYVTPDPDHVYGRHDILLPNGCPNPQYQFLQPGWGFRKREETSPVNSLFFTQTGWMKAARFDKRNDFTVTKEIHFVCEAGFCWRPGDTNCDDFCATSTAVSGRRRRDLSTIEDNTTVRLSSTITLTDDATNTSEKRSGLPTTYIYLLVGLGVFFLVLVGVVVGLCRWSQRRRQRDMKYKHYVDNSSAVSEFSSKNERIAPVRGSTC